MNNNITAIREIRNISQIQLSEMVGVRHWHINHIERGKRRLSTMLLEKIAEALDVSVKDFFLE